MLIIRYFHTHMCFFARNDPAILDTYTTYTCVLSHLKETIRVARVCSRHCLTSIIVCVFVCVCARMRGCVWIHVPIDLLSSFSLSLCVCVWICVPRCSHLEVVFYSNIFASMWALFALLSTGEAAEALTFSFAQPMVFTYVHASSRHVPGLFCAM